jgi:two-component system chemotaxis response regulator CheY
VKGHVLKDFNLDMQILIVDDSLSMRRILKKFLGNNGFHNIVESQDGLQALDRIQKKSVDLIISDLNMPGMNGLEFLKIVKKDSRTQGIPFIMLTVEAIQKTMNKAIALGVDSYIVKPVTEDIFIKEMLRVIKDKSNI